MTDQAQALRDWVKNTGQKQPEWQEEPDSRPAMRVITVSSGKGGVGKSSFAVNFSLALAKRQKQVLILDADFGLSNIDLLFGQTVREDLSKVLSGEKTLEQVMTAGHFGVRFISGGSGLSRLMQMDGGEAENVLSQLAALEGQGDFLLVDTSAGVNDVVMHMIQASDETIVVMTPEPTSIMDAFALCKEIFRQDRGAQVRLVINRAESAAEANNTATNFIGIVEKYLGAKVKLLGYLPFDQAVIQAVKGQMPYMVGDPSCPAAQAMGRIAESYLEIPHEKALPVKGLKRFLQIFRRK